jgi:hypothetical protein
MTPTKAQVVAWLIATDPATYSDVIEIAVAVRNIEQAWRNEPLPKKLGRPRGSRNRAAPEVQS